MIVLKCHCRGKHGLEQSHDLERKKNDVFNAKLFLDVSKELM